MNSLSWERTDLIKLPKDYRGAMDSKQRTLACQEVDGFCYAVVTVPSCGYTDIHKIKENDAFEITENGSCQAPEDMARQVYVKNLPDGYSMENGFIRIIIDFTGRLTSIYDKIACIEFADGLCNDIRMYQDINIDYDAWEISSFYEELSISLNEDAKVTILNCGPILGRILITREINESLLMQEILMTSFSRRIDFKTRIDWKETHKLLKVAFPVKVIAEEAMEEIQFGYVKRPTHRSRRYDADRFEVCNHKYTVLAEAERGFAVLNDCKYGVSTNDGSIELSLLRAPLQPDMHADKGLQEFTYAIYAYAGSFYDSDVVKQGYELNTGLLQSEGNGATKSLTHRFISIPKLQ